MIRLAGRARNFLKSHGSGGVGSPLPDPAVPDPRGSTRPVKSPDSNNIIPHNGVFLCSVFCVIPGSLYLLYFLSRYVLFSSSLLSFLSVLVISLPPGSSLLDEASRSLSTSSAEMALQVSRIIGGVQWASDYMSFSALNSSRVRDVALEP